MRVARFLMLITLGTSFVSVVGCGDTGLWGRDPEMVLQDLSAGRHEFLRHLEPEAVQSADIFRLHEGAGYLLGRVYERLRQIEQAQRAYQRQIELDTEPYQRAALSALLVLGSSVDRELLSQWAEAALQDYPEEQELQLQALTALYDAQHFQRYLELQPDGLSDRPELALMSAVARFELGRDGWESGMRGLFADFPARSEHSRLFIYMHNHDAARDAFSEAEHALFEGKHAVVEGRSQDAAEHFRQLDLGGLPPAYRNGVLARDMGRAFTRARYYSVGDGLLADLAELMPQENVARARHERAQLAMAGGNTASARAILEELLGGSAAWPVNQSLRRAAFGDYLELLSRSAVDRIPTALRAHRSLWKEADAYSSLLERLTNDLVRSRDWFLLADLVELLEENGRSAPAEQYRLVLAAALEAGLYRPDRDSDFAERRDLLEPLREATRPYYRIMGRVLLGENPEAAMEAALTAPAMPADADTDRALTRTQAYLEFGLTERAYTLARRYGTAFPPTLVEQLARRAASEGNLITAIRLAGEIRGNEFRREVAELRYPLGFAADVEAVVELHGLDSAIFYGMIREESHFSASIVSHAGAVGLAQLMPSTARDVAGRMRLSDYELTDPATNLALGAHYLSYLRDRFPSYLHALAAYNGGQGRVRRWIDRFSLDGILFHEAIPLQETRHYVRKVVVSAAYYGYLYDNRSPGEIVQPIFPGLQSSAGIRHGDGSAGS